MKSCSQCNFAILVFMSNVIAMFYQPCSSASFCPVQLESYHNTRASSSNKLLLSQVTRSVDYHCFFVAGTQYWNELPKSTTVLTDINMFKKCLLVFILNRLIYKNATFYSFLIIYFVLLIDAVFLHFIIITNIDCLGLLLILFTICGVKNVCNSQLILRQACSF